MYIRIRIKHIMRMAQQVKDFYDLQCAGILKHIPSRKYFCCPVHKSHTRTCTHYLKISRDWKKPGVSNLCVIIWMKPFIKGNREKLSSRCRKFWIGRQGGRSCWVACTCMQYVIRRVNVQSVALASGLLGTKLENPKDWLILIVIYWWQAW